MSGTDLRLRRDPRGAYFVVVNGEHVNLGRDLDAAKKARDRAAEGWREVRPIGVYCVVGPPGFLKIGVAKNPNQRLGCMQTGCPYPLRVAGVRWFATAEEAYDLENQLKEELRFARARGGGVEWFHRRPRVESRVKALLNIDVIPQGWKDASVHLRDKPSSLPNLDEDDL